MAQLTPQKAHRPSRRPTPLAPHSSQHTMVRVVPTFPFLSRPSCGKAVPHTLTGPTWAQHTCRWGFDLALRKPCCQRLSQFGLDYDDGSMRAVCPVKVAWTCSLRF